MGTVREKNTWSAENRDSNARVVFLRKIKTFGIHVESMIKEIKLFLS